MEYIRLFENESEIPSTLTDALIGTKDGKVKMIVPVPEPAYKIKVSANGPGQIIVNQGLGVDVLTIDGVTYPRIDIYDKVVDRTHYYAYGDFVSVGGVYMVTDNTVGEYENKEVYWLCFYDTCNRNNDNDLTIDGVNYYCFGDLYLKTTTPGTYGANDLFIIEDGETVQTITDAWGFIYDEFIIKEDGNGVLMYYMTSNGEYTYTIEAPESIENKQQVLNYTAGEDQWLGCDTEIVNVYAVLNDYDEEIHWIGNTTLTSIEIPDSVTTIDRLAFCSCSGLTSINIPDSVTSIGLGAFASCTGLTSVTIGSGVTSIGIESFYGCSGLTSINIPNSVTSIGSSTFYGCSSLTSIEIPDSVTSIAECTFQNCPGLTSITIGNGVKSIASYAFSDCSNLTSITCKAITAPSIVSDTFSNINENGTLYYPSGSDYSSWLSTGDYYLGYYGWNGSQIPVTIVSVKDIQVLTNPIYADKTSINATYTLVDSNGAEYDRTNSCIAIPENTTGSEVSRTVSVTDLGYTFDIEYTQNSEEAPYKYIISSQDGGKIKFNATYLNEDGYIYNGGTKYYRQPELDANGLYALTDGVDTTTRFTSTDLSAYNEGDVIDVYFYPMNNPPYTMSNCTVFKKKESYDGPLSQEVTFSAGENQKVICDTPIREFTFTEGKSGLTKVVMSDSTTDITNYAFADCSGLTSIEIPDSVTTIGNYAFQCCTGLTSVTIGNGVTSIGYCAFDYCSGLTSINIPDSVTSIGFDAFSSCTGLTSVTIGSGVTSIGRDVFRGCTGLTSIEIPNSVTSIGLGAFASCTGLTSVTIGSGVTSIGIELFYGCSGLTSINIPNSVTTIGQYAFQNCTGLTSINIPDSVTSIGNYAFAGCTVLTSITYNGTIEQWNSVTKNTGWNQNVPATVVHCSDGYVTL